MAKRQLFSVVTPLGYRVALSRDRWRQIVGFKHPALKGSEKAIRQCLETPALIRESLKEADVHLYYKESDKGYICVATAPGEDDTRFVVTAYYTRNIKKGTELWKK